jgi:hypothetical protein
MKNKIICNSLIIFMMIIFISGCKEEHEVKRVSTSEAVYKELMTKNKMIIDDFINKVYLNKEIKDFISDSTKSVKKMESEDKENQILLEMLSDYSEIPLDKKHTITFDNFVLISSKNNLSNTIFNNNREQKADFTIGYFEPSLREVSNATMERNLVFWSYLIDKPKNSKPTKYDSIDQQSVDRIKNDFQEDFNRFSKIKYLIYIKDIVYKEPKLVSDSIFDSGVLYSKVKVIDFKTQKKIAEKRILVENDSIISTLGMMGKEMASKTLLIDLIKQRENKMVDCLRIK